MRRSYVRILQFTDRFCTPQGDGLWPAPVMKKVDEPIKEDLGGDSFIQRPFDGYGYG